MRYASESYNTDAQVEWNEETRAMIEHKDECLFLAREFLNNDDRKHEWSFQLQVEGLAKFVAEVMEVAKQRAIANSADICEFHGHQGMANAIREKGENG